MICGAFVVFRDGVLPEALPLPFEGILHVSYFICLVCGALPTVKYCK
jgi:hypothetical protein